jgi:hypothetical protein
MNFYVEPRGKTGTGDDGLKWLAVDLDGTLAQAIWPLPGIGAPISQNVEKLQEAVNAGWKVIIHTSRSWTDYEMIEDWAAIHGVPAHRILCGKVLAARYIDDRNIDPNADSWIP